MDISTIFISQRNLKRYEQIPSMIKSLDSLPPIILIELEDNSIQVNDGHHRLAAIWLSGQTSLDKSQYILLQQRQWRPKFGHIEDLLR